jgi:hypothetical protein
LASSDRFCIVTFTRWIASATVPATSSGEVSMAIFEPP